MDTIVLAAGIVPNATSAAADVTRVKRGPIVTNATLRSVSDPHAADGSPQAAEWQRA